MRGLVRLIGSPNGSNPNRRADAKETAVPIPGSDSAAVPTPGAATNDEEFLGLHAERASLERSLTLAQARQRFGADAADIAQAHEEEGRLLASLDGVMTQIRAAEYRRRPGARRW